MKMSNTFRETFVTYETFDQTDEKTWLDQQKDKDIKRTSSKKHSWDTHYFSDTWELQFQYSLSSCLLQSAWEDDDSPVVPTNPLPVSET